MSMAAIGWSEPVAARRIISMKAATWRVGVRCKVSRQMGRPAPAVDNGRHRTQAVVAAKARGHHLYQGRYAVGDTADTRLHRGFLQHGLQVFPVSAAVHRDDQRECGKRVGLDVYGLG
jgi:hypothetical protein